MPVGYFPCKLRFFSTVRNKLTICILCRNLLFLVEHPLHSFTCDFPFEKKTNIHWHIFYSRNFGGFRETSTPSFELKKIMKQLKEWNSKKEREKIYLELELPKKKRLSDTVDLQPPPSPNYLFCEPHVIPTTTNYLSFLFASTFPYSLFIIHSHRAK